MAPELPEALWAGWMGLEGIRGLTVRDGFTWNPQYGKWVFRCRLSADILEGGLVPPSTDWYVLVDGDYPNGGIEFLPAKQEGLTLTFQHQRYNSSNDQNRDDPWRRGAICLDTTMRALGRHGHDNERRGAATRLPWRLRRALDWLSRASRNALVVPGEPYELPDFPIAPELGLIAFSEDRESLGRWAGFDHRCGLVEGRRLVATREVKVVTAFLAPDGTRLTELEWGHTVSSAKATWTGAWLHLEKLPVLTPYQAPATWGELVEVCAAQGANLYDLLQPTVPALRDGERHPLLAGFPIPARVGEPPVSVHWQAMLLPVLSRGKGVRHGFSTKVELGYWLEDKGSLLVGRKALDWMRSENWSSDQVSVRGRVSDALSSKKVLIIGVGAVGSVVAELLVRGGVRQIVLMDSDAIAAGNLVRHTLTLDSIGQDKATAIAARLNLASPHANVEAIAVSFPPTRSADISAMRECDVIVDCTASDDVLPRLNAAGWDGPRHFFSLSTGFGAKRLFVFSAYGKEFPHGAFTAVLQPWLADERKEYEQADLPREGTGCWDPVLPARVDDVWTLSSLAVRCIEARIAQPGEASRLEVFERHWESGEFQGIRRVSKVAESG